MKASKAVQRYLVRILDQIDRDALDEARAGIAALCDDVVGGKPVGKLFHPRPVPHVEPKPVGTAMKQPAGQQPEKRKRVEDPVAIEAYREAHPVCEVHDPQECLYAAKWPDEFPNGELAGRPKPDVHHIIKRSKGGDGPGDVEHNFLSLCRAHHTGRYGWHVLRPEPLVWYKRYHRRLPIESNAKILRSGVLDRALAKQKQLASPPEGSAA